MQGQAWVQGIGMLLVVLLVLTILFLLLREFLCWYWKINEGLSELRAIRGTLETVEHKLSAAASASAPAVGAGGAAAGAVAEKTVVRTECYKCGRPLNGKRYCEACKADNA
jgi:hypothetical protein